MGYILGLDLGSSSVGWAAVEVDADRNFLRFMRLKDSDPTNPDSANKTIPAIGVRLFPAGVEKYGLGKKEETRNKKRRESRLTRRRLRRAKARRLGVLKILRENDLAPKDAPELVELQKNQDPYRIRADAINQKVSLFELGRAILHMAKRRGFKSNRKDLTKEQEDTQFQQAIKNAENIAESTLGCHWQVQRCKNPKESIRNRLGKYKFIPVRKQYEKELKQIWSTQERYYPKLRSPGLLSSLLKVLLDQQTYLLSNRKKRKVIGRCSLIPSKLRCGYDDRRAQEYRLLQKVNDLQITRKGKVLDISGNRDALVAKLMLSDEVSFSEIRKILFLEPTDKINFEFEGSKALIGNEIDCQIIKSRKLKKENRIIGPIVPEEIWSRLEDTQKNRVWSAILAYFDEKLSLLDTVSTIESVSGCTVADSEAITRIQVPTKNLEYSAEALDRILPFMRQGSDMYEAIQKAGFKRHHQTVDLLPLPDPAHGYRITNPNVRTALFEIRKVVNSLIRELGRPDQIIIEFTRDFKADKEHRQEILQGQSKRKQDKDRAAIRICEYPETDWSNPSEVPGWAIEKYLLWEDQGEICPYTVSDQRKISIRKLFSRETEVDHILPYSMSLDDTLDNKVVCFDRENQKKEQRTPFDWLSHDVSRWETLQRAIDHWNPKRKNRAKEQPTDIALKPQKKCKNIGKWERFFITADMIDELFFSERYLRETGHIANACREFLQQLYDHNEAEQKVSTTKGGMSFQLRKWWDLNGILGEGGREEKNRSDHRHHALDAAVIAVTTNSMLKKVTAELRRAYPKIRPRDIFVPRPWPTFDEELKDAIRHITVSHRVDHKVKGGLHKETFYGKEIHGPNKDKFITREFVDERLSKNKAESICDPTVRKIILDRLAKYNDDPKAAFTEPVYLTDKLGNPKSIIHRVRTCSEKTAFPIRGTTKNPCHAPNENLPVWVKSENNHHIEIFRNATGKIHCRVWSMFDMATRIKDASKSDDKIKNLITTKENPKGMSGNYVMSLWKGDMVIMNGKTSNVPELVRISFISGDTSKIDLEVRPVYLADSKGDKSLDDQGKAQLKQQKAAVRREWRLTDLQELPNTIIRKVTVDPLGRIRRAND